MTAEASEQKTVFISNLLLDLLWCMLLIINGDDGLTDTFRVNSSVLLVLHFR